MFDHLVGVDQLAAHPEWVVVDCRHALTDFSLGRKLYNEAHIPGAFFADVETDLAGNHTGTNGRHPLPEPETFANFLRSIGVNNDTQVVAYDAGGDMFAARFWFLCKWIGHDSAAVLDGGMTAWLAGNKPVTADAPIAAHTGNLHVRMRNNLVVGVDFVLHHLGSHDVQLLDARAADRFAGQNELVDPVAGHIPGALNRPFKSNFDESGRFKSADTLRRELAGYNPSRIVQMCGSGVSAAVNMLSMEIAGRSGSRLYSGSWSEWIADPSRPITTTE